MPIRHKGREWIPLAVGPSTYMVRLDHGCPGQWTAVAVAPSAPGRSRVVAVSAGPFRAPVLRLLRERLGGEPAREHPSADRIPARRPVR